MVYYKHNKEPSKKALVIPILKPKTRNKLPQNPVYTCA